ncbi:hypothetical protein BW13_02535 [Bifidobacterium sp. UTCIF-37]|uniref:hypothetical protein n=1 Tax=unclassified Bifidobacterium TaxID=2608897 RepID=UPI0011284255|nr:MULTISPECIES: hypothetical protein [unclassified Bifidobacterium]TPF86851.1 hypothetical protein BW13_02535 [Bifidobacterium sp. UTCIF-37]TPF90456.1 hypothetical protein BW11_02555 [Bifidobacterium sp. UTCIF-38]
MNLMHSKKVIAASLAAIALLVPASQANASMTTGSSYATDVMSQSTNSGERLKPHTYALAVDTNQSSTAIRLTLSLGAGNSVASVSDGSVNILDSAGNLVTNLPTDAEMIEKQNPDFIVGKWVVESPSQASLFIASKDASSTVSTLGFRWPRKGWYQCLSDHGISGAIAGAVAGCAGTATEGCVAGALAGFPVAGIAGIVSGLWLCRSKY